MGVLFAAAGLAEMSAAQQRELAFTVFLFSTIPSAAALVGALAWWIVTHRRALRSRQLRIRSILVLIAALSPGLVLLKLVWWPYYWF